MLRDVRTCNSRDMTSLHAPLCDQARTNDHERHDDDSNAPRPLGATHRARPAMLLGERLLDYRVGYRIGLLPHRVSCTPTSPSEQEQMLSFILPEVGHYTV